MSCGNPYKHKIQNTIHFFLDTFSGRNSNSRALTDDLFLLLAKGNGLSPRNMFDQNNLVKQAIRVETVERVEKCRSWTEDAIPKIVLERTGKPATPEFIEGATNSFALWWMSTYERIIKQEKTTSSRSSRI